MKRRFCIRLIGFMAAMGVGCCVQAEVVYSNDFTGAEFIAPGRSVSTFYQNAAEIGGQLVPTNGAVSGMLVNLSALDLMNDAAVTMVKVTAVASRGSDWQTVGFATQTDWQHPDTAEGKGFSPYFWMPQGQLRSGRGHFSGGTEWDADGDTPANMPLTVEMTFYKNTSSTNDDSVSVVIQGTTVFDQQVLEYGTTGGANLAGVQLVFGNDVNQYFDSVVVEADLPPPPPPPTLVESWEFNTMGDTEGWTSSGVDGLDVSNAVSGAEIVIASGSILNNDPQIKLNAANLSPGFSVWQECTVRKRLLDADDNPVAFSSAGTLLLLQTNGVNALYLSPANTVESDGWGIHTYDISGLDAETISLVRFDAVAGWAATNQNFEIDYIRFYEQTPQAVVGYEDWISGYGLTNGLALPGADPDGDLYDNSFEYAFGGNPTNEADIGLMPVASVVDVGSNVLEVVSYERSGEGSGLTYSLEGRENLVLGSWTGLVETVDYTVVGTGTYNIEMDAVTNHIPADADTTFVQVKATAE